MSRHRRLTALAIVSLILLSVGRAAACGNVEIVRSLSPSGKLAAVMFNRHCGATTGFSTQISIVPMGEEAMGIGNVFRADTDHGAAQVGAWGGPWAELQWLSPTQLMIRYAANARIFERKARRGDVEIIYEARQRGRQ